MTAKRTTKPRASAASKNVKAVGTSSKASKAGKTGKASTAPKVSGRGVVRRAKPVDAARAARLMARLAAHDPEPRCALDHANPFELVAATILSAQCTDERVNKVTPQLFARWPTPADLADADVLDVEEVVHSTGFFRNKAKNLVGMARRLVDVFGGEVPRGMDDLLSLPGVARKTANVVRGECFGLADGVVVDTHVNRIGKRIGFTDQSDPVQVERDLMRIVPRDQWIAFSHRLIRLGRTYCPARKPDCAACPLRDDCPRIGVASP